MTANAGIALDKGRTAAISRRSSGKLEIGGSRVYISGDTDLFGDMKTIGERYQPNVAFVCVGNGPFTMGRAKPPAPASG